MLDIAGYRPTVGEIAKITRLPKSSVCRYVAKQISQGYIREVIDPRDHRRRLLHPTARAKDELKWHKKEFSDFLNLLEAVDWNVGRRKQKAAGLNLIEVFSNVTPKDV